MMKKFIFISIFLFLSTSLFAQKWLWGAQGTSSSDTWGAAADSKGNAYLTGVFNNSISFGSKTLNSPNFDAYFVKYDTSGNVIWAVQSILSSARADAEGVFVAPDNYGNEYLAGVFLDTVIFGAHLLTTPRLTQSVFLTKYDANGNVLWVSQGVLPSSTSLALCWSAATDSIGNVYFTGHFCDTITFGTYTLTASKLNSFNTFLVKYDANGNVLWARQSVIPSTISNGIGYSVAIDKKGNVYMAGNFADTISFGAYTLTSINDRFQGDAFLVKYDANGNVLWVNKGSFPSSAGYATAYSVINDQAGNVYMTGYFYDTISFGKYVLVDKFNTAIDAFLVKYDANGNVIWAEQSNSVAKASFAGYSLAVDDFNNLYLSGGYLYGQVIFGKDTFPTDTIDSDPAVVMKLDTSGKVLCGSLIKTGGDDNNTVAVDPTGRYVYLGGDIERTIIFGNDTLVDSAITEPPFIARWEPCDIPTDTVPVAPPPLQEPCNSFIPDAFSPNGDGHNDILYVRGDCIKTMDFVIYDRWGNKVFESTNISYGWDGTYKGQPENTATFAYYLHAILFNGSAEDKHGNVSLVR
jgi:gliding motility-associated-like protein